jgi:hypothetical protein
MNILRALIREAIELNDEDVESSYFGVKESKLGQLADDLIAAFTEFGSEPSDETMREIHKRWGPNIKFIGSGSYRFVFSISKDFVIKISLDGIGDTGLEDSGHEMNRLDFEIGNNAELKNIMPRAYEHAPDFKWVVLERVQPIESESRYLSFFRSRFLPNPHTLDEEGKEIYRGFIYAALQLRSPFFENNKLLRSIGNFGPKWEHGDVTLGELRKDFKDKSTAFFGLQEAIKRHKIDTNEIHADNLGIGSDGRLVLLDSSVFPNRI